MAAHTPQVNNLQIYFLKRGDITCQAEACNCIVRLGCEWMEQDMRVQVMTLPNRTFLMVPWTMRHNDRIPNEMCSETIEQDISRIYPGFR